MLDTEFWKGKKVLVTGDTGFKGSWLCLWLNHLGAEVWGYSCAPPWTRPCLYNLTNVGKVIGHRDGDVVRFSGVAEVMKDFQPEIVFHLAAQAIIWKAYEDPMNTFRTNVMGTVNVLEAVRSTPPVKALVCVTSDKCYENAEWEWGYRENDRLGGDDPYAASKACAEMAINAYQKSYFSKGGVRVASARAGNVVGGGDWAPDRLVPDIVRALSRGETIVIRHPESTRPWQHVLDPLYGYILLAQELHTPTRSKLGFPTSFNFGPGEANLHTVEDVVREAKYLWGGGEVAPDTSHSKDFHENKFLGLDSTRARQWLGWRARLSFEKTISWTILWYKQVLEEGGDARNTCLTQIEEYMNIFGNGG